jgi:hypothetical protein
MPRQRAKASGAGSTARKTPAATKPATTRRTRSIRSKTSGRGRAAAAGSGDTAQRRSAAPAAARQIIVLALALAFGLLGLAVHVFWLVAIVLMSVTLGLIAAEVRGRGVLPELAAEAKSLAAEISSAEARLD